METTRITTTHVEIAYRIPGRRGSRRKVFEGTSADKKARRFAAKVVKRDGAKVRWFRWEEAKS